MIIGIMLESLNEEHKDDETTETKLLTEIVEQNRFLVKEIKELKMAMKKDI